MAELTELSVGQGETFGARITIQNTNGSFPLDITNYTIQGQVRENYTTDDIAASFLVNKIIPQESGSFTISLLPEQTINLTQRKYVYDITISSGSGAQPITRRVLEGAFTVRPAVTR
jgi:hypothetical protein